MTPTPPLPPEDADVTMVREQALTWLRGQRSDDGKTEDIINGLLAKLQEAERERDEERERFHRHVEEMIEPKILARAEAAEVRLQEAERERDEFAEAMHKASLSVMRRRSLATADPRASK